MPSYGHEFLQKILNFVEMSKNFGIVISQSEFLLEIVPETTQTSILVKLVRGHSARHTFNQVQILILRSLSHE